MTASELVDGVVLWGCDPAGCTARGCFRPADGEGPPAGWGAEAMVGQRRPERLLHYCSVHTRHRLTASPGPRSAPGRFTAVSGRPWARGGAAHDPTPSPARGPLRDP